MEEITIPAYARYATIWKGAGQLESDDFLDADEFMKLVLHPFRDGPFRPAIRDRSSSSFNATGWRRRSSVHGSMASSVHASERLSAMPWRFAIPACWVQPIIKVLSRNQASAHVYNHWSYRPSLAEQTHCMGTFTAPFTVLATPDAG